MRLIIQNNLVVFFHLQRPISTLHLRVDPQQIQVFELDENDEIELFLPHEQSIEMMTRDANQQHQDHLLQALDLLFIPIHNSNNRIIRLIYYNNN